MAQFSLTPANGHDLEALLREFEASDLVEMHLLAGKFELYLSHDRDGQPDFGISAASAIVPAQPAPTATASQNVQPLLTGAAVAASANAIVADGHTVVRAPYLGIFYRAPKPGAPNLVEVGDTVEAGTDLCLVEVMKLFTAVCAEARGVIAQVFAQDGETVSEGQPLFALAPVR